VEEAYFCRGSQRNRNEMLLTKLLTKATVGVLPPDRDTAHHYARLFVQLRRAATPIPTNDVWIAALALQHDLTLATRDRHFAQIPQLLRI
jgi:tRNA(fMet)-specific endonuclease VapC